MLYIVYILVYILVYVYNNHYVIGNSIYTYNIYNNIYTRPHTS